MEWLVRVAVGGKIEGKVEPGGDIYTQRYLTGGEKNGELVEEKVDSGWEVDTEHNCDSVRLGGWGDQKWNMLWVEGEFRRD